MQSALPGSPSITKAEYEPSSRGAESRLCSPMAWARALSLIGFARAEVKGADRGASKREVRL